jgi:hypothetical protein
VHPSVVRTRLGARGHGCADERQRVRTHRRQRRPGDQARRLDDRDPTDWSAPDTSGQFPVSFITIPTSVTLANPGDQMRFTFAELLATKVPEVFNPAAGGSMGQPLFNGPGLVFGGTCTVTAT